MIQISVKCLSLQWFKYRGFDFCFRTSIKSKQSDCSAYCSCSKTGRELIQLMIRIISQSVPDKGSKEKTWAFVRCTEAFIYKVFSHVYIYICIYTFVSLLGVFKHRPQWLNMLDGFLDQFLVMFQGDIHSCLATFLLISWQKPAVVPTSKGNPKNKRQTSHIIKKTIHEETTTTRTRNNHITPLVAKATCGLFFEVYDRL